MLELKIRYSISEDMLEKIKKIEEKLSKIHIEEQNKKINISTKSRVRSVYSSLAIEDNPLSLETVEKITKDKLVLAKRTDVQEVKNANELYENMDNYNYLNEEDFLKAHLLLMKYFEDDNGTYRGHGEGVKKDDEIIFMAPDSILVPTFMNNLFTFINENNNIVHQIILSAVFHYYLVYIHPFTDGNGRIARFWVSLMLRNYNSNFEYIPIEEEIYRCLAVDENGNEIDGDKILAIMSKYMMEKETLNKNTVVATVMSNLGLKKYAENNKLNFVFMFTTSLIILVLLVLFRANIIYCL